MISDSPRDCWPRQATVYRQYLKLQSIAAKLFTDSLAGKLVLNIGFDLQGSELALATTIAGGAFLGIDPDPQLLKAAVHNGSCDFMVNTLDEALRVLKNELRKRTPLSTGLLGDPSDILTAMIERGVQPDLLGDRPASESPDSALNKFVERGAEILTESLTPVDSAADQVVWTAANPQDLRRIDKVALDLMPQVDRIRRRWLELAAGSFYRQVPLQRVLGMPQQERESFLEALKKAGDSLPFHSPAEVRWQETQDVERAVSILPK